MSVKAGKTYDDDNVFIMLPTKIMKIQGLTPAEKHILARIAGFDRYYESPTRCSELLGYSVETIKAARKKLESAGYIKCVSQTWRGKKYVAEAKWKIPKDFLKKARKMQRELFGLEDDYTEDEENTKTADTTKNLEKKRGVYTEGEGGIAIPPYTKKEKNLNPPFTPPQVGGNGMVIPPQQASEEKEEKTHGAETFKVSQQPKKAVEKPKVVITASKSEPRQRMTQTFERKYPDLVEIRAQIIDYLQDNYIPIFSMKSLNRGLIALANAYRSEEDSQQHLRVLNGYLKFLNSPQYKYQCQMNKYCPRISRQADIFDKMYKIRDFAHDSSRWYDPSKTLTP